MDDLTPVESAIFVYLAKAIEAGFIPDMFSLAEQFYWLPLDTLHHIVNVTLYERGYITFETDADTNAVPSLVIVKRPTLVGR